MSIGAATVAMPSRAAAAEPRQIPVHRFGPPPGAAGADFAELDGDRRGVLFGYPLKTLHAKELVWNRETGRVSVNARRPTAARLGARLQVTPRVVHDRVVDPIAPIVATVRPDSTGAPGLTFDLEHPALRAEGGTLRLKWLLLPDWKSNVRTGELSHLPPNAKLRFSVAFQSPTPAGGATQFSVAVCRSGSCAKVFDEQVRSGDAPEGWRDREVDLGPYAGGSATLRFETVRSSAEATELPLWSVPTLYGPEPAAHRGPNLLLISVDTLRADHLGTYGYARDTSPFIDRELAAKGTVFERCISTATTTAPSHMSMFTGLAPTVHGVHGEDFLLALDGEIATLAEVLRRAGFETGAVTENGAMGAYRGFSRGFTSYYENRHRKLFRRKLDFAGHIENTLDRSLDWLERNRGTRFFLFVHTYQVHQPYTPPPAFEKFFEGDDVDGRLAQRLPPKFQPISYDREIRYTDASLREFFSKANARGLLEDTVVVLVSDHGDQFVEHGAIGHGPFLYDEVLHVPLIVRGPGIAAGRRVEEPVSLVDLMPTLLAWTGTDHRDSPARSFARRATEPVPQPPKEAPPIFSEARQGKAQLFTKKNGVRGARFQTPVFAIRVGDLKLIRTLGPPGAVSSAALPVGGVAPSYEYFDLATDPQELHDRWGPTEAEALRLRDLLEEHIARSELRRRALEAETQPEPPTPTALDAERREKLRALGYLE